MILAWVATAGFIGLIAWSFNRPLPERIETLEWASPLFHFGGFFLATLLAHLAASVTPSLRSTTLWIPVATTTAGFAVEVLQIASPIHDAALDDIVVNGLGAFTAYLLYLGVRRLLRS